MLARSLKSLALLTALALAACSGGGDPAASQAALGAGRAAAASTPARNGPPADSMAGGNKVLPVMTRNLYLGADLTPAIVAGSPQEFVQATTTIWAMVNKNSFTLRVEGVADEIADERPALVGLQEAYVWTHTPAATAENPSPATEVVYDYVTQILDALKARGLSYRVASSVELFHFAAPIVGANGLDTISLTDHGVILARNDVTTSKPEQHVFSTLLPLTVMGQDIHVQRGWVSVIVKYRGETFRFVSTHLEAFEARVRTVQGMELAAALAPEKLPLVLVGDLNSTVDEMVQLQPPPADPVPGARAILGLAGFQDVWQLLHPTDPGLTCCFPEDLTKDGPFDSRIDYVLFRGLFEPREIEILGATPEEKVSGLWPSDHAGVAATVRILDPRFVR